VRNTTMAPFFLLIMFESYLQSPESWNAAQ
jgi:hypothetical protein